MKQHTQLPDTWSVSHLYHNRQNFMYVDFGYLADFVIESLLTSPSVLHRSKCALVNVSAPREGFSVGTLTKIPEVLKRPGTRLVLTFATDGVITEDDILPDMESPDRIVNTFHHIFEWRHYNWVSKSERGAFRFISVVFRSDRRFSPTNIPPGITRPLLNYIWYAMGLVTANFIKFKPLFNSKQRLVNDYSRYFQGHELDFYKNVYLDKPLFDLTLNAPFLFWGFNKHLWMRLPSFISPKFLTQFSTLYVRKYLYPLISPVILTNRQFVRRGIGQRVGLISGGGGILDILADSVHNGEFNDLSSFAFSEVEVKKGAANGLNVIASEDLDEDLYNLLWNNLLGASHGFK